MNRTRKLMTCVTTSLLMAGGRSLVLAHDGANAALAQGSSRPDPKVKQAADDISEWLKDTPKDEAKTSEEIAHNFPSLQPGQIQDALNQLKKNGELRTTGNGTKADPYRYFGSRPSTIS